jgi:hypothetical protein
MPFTLQPFPIKADPVSGGTSPMTTTAIDTTGLTTPLALAAIGLQNAGTFGSFGDSKTNTYSTDGSVDSYAGGGGACHIAWSQNAAVGAGHTQSLTKPGGYETNEATIMGLVVGGAKNAAPRIEFTANTAVDASITPTQVGALLLSFWYAADYTGGNNTYSIDPTTPGWTLIDGFGNSNGYNSGAFAYRLAADLNPHPIKWKSTAALEPSSGIYMVEVLPGYDGLGGNALGQASASGSLTTQAIPTYVGKGTFTSGTAALSVPWPAGYQAGDEAHLVVESANQAIAAPSGWMEVANSPQFTGTAAAAGGVRLAVFRKAAAASESNVAVADTGDHQAAQIHVYRGVNQAAPINATAGAVLATAGTAITCPAVTTTSPRCLVVNYIANDRDAASTTNLSGWTNANLANLTERHDQTVTAGAGGGLGVAVGALLAAGSSGTTAVTNAASVTAAMITVALAPIPAPIVLDGTAAVQTSASGDLSTGGTAAALVGGAAAQASAAGALTTAIPVAGASLSVATGGGALSTGIPFAGVAAAVAAASASMSSGAAAFAGNAAAAASGAGQLSTFITFSSAALAQALSSALLTTGITMTAAAVMQAAADGTLGTAIALLGAAGGQASASGSLTAGSGLSGAAAGNTSASAALTIQIRFAAAAFMEAAAAAGLDTAILLAGQGAGQAGASGTLSGGALFTGAAGAAALANADLTTSITLTAAALAQAIAAGGLTVEVGMAGLAAAFAGGAADMATQILMGGAAAVAAAATGSLDIGVPVVLDSRHEIRTRRTFTVATRRTFEVHA